MVAGDRAVPYMVKLNIFKLGKIMPINLVSRDQWSLLTDKPAENIYVLEK